MDYENVTYSACILERGEPAGIIIFGASGDLTKRKLLPSLYGLLKRSLMPNKFYIIGCGRSKMSDDEFRALTEDALKGIVQDEEKKKLFVANTHYVSLDYNDEGSFKALKNKIDELDKKVGIKNHLYHTATPPSVYLSIAQNLHKNGLIEAERDDGLGYNRVIFEKPFGYDLESAVELHKSLHKIISEKDIYRIDHYLGKETVQNILMTRFANSIFEPLWNRNYIDNIQITVHEKLGIENRGGYFDGSGLLRDMFQNHILQLIALISMEPPVSFDGEMVRDERCKLMRSIRNYDVESVHLNAIRAQYTKSEINGVKYNGYKEENGVAKDSLTETYAGVKLFIDNWRWNGVPFYIRAGKAMKEKSTKICITFKQVPYAVFSHQTIPMNSSNILTFRIQPNEGVDISVKAKSPGSKLSMASVPLSFDYQSYFGVEVPEAYERLIFDCMVGDQTLFWRDDSIERAWKVIAPILEVWKNDKSIPMYEYPYGSSGPRELEQMFRDNKEHRFYCL